MAEAWTRHLKSDRIDAYSAGVDPHGIDPGRSRSWLRSESIFPGKPRSISTHLQGIEFDYVITLCDHANESCPFFPGKTRRLHMGFDDPPKLAAGCATEEEALEHYRRVRDEIKAFAEKLPAVLEEEH